MYHNKALGQIFELKGDELIKGMEKNAYRGAASPVPLNNYYSVDILINRLIGIENTYRVEMGTEDSAAKKRPLLRPM
jgi:hypothetical protein